MKDSTRPAPVVYWLTEAFFPPLVGGQEPAKIRDAFRAFARARLPADCKAELTGHSGAPAENVDIQQRVGAQPVGAMH